MPRPHGRVSCAKLLLTLMAAIAKVGASRKTPPANTASQSIEQEGVTRYHRTSDVRNITSLTRAWIRVFMANPKDLKRGAVAKGPRVAGLPPAVKQRASNAEAAIGEKRGGSAKANRQRALNLASLCEGMKGLTSACGAVLAESAAVCLEDRNHAQGVILNVAGESEAAYPLDWEPVSEQQRRCYNDLQEATERGASGIAILLVERLTGMTVLERSKKRTGFDYWIGPPGDETLLFQGKTRLEVSGILAGPTSAVAGRVKTKLAQVKPTDKEAPAYIAVIEFGTPASQVVYKCQT